MDPASEAHLVSHVMEGDRAALGDLLERYQHRLFNIVRRMVGNREDAVDVTGQAMINIVQGISGYRGPASLSTWMIRIAMNAAISYRRKQRLRQTISLDGSDSNSHEDQSSPLRDQLANERELEPDQSVQQREELALLQVAIG
ncbi:MAG: sigma-70 family RNA polymerase sigma factor, partial [Pirellulaceae bacterium]|nr:sigma-70 family RNA polymerase sigma factor [Pirellulaceae bacterium]